MENNADINIFENTLTSRVLKSSSSISTSPWRANQKKKKMKKQTNKTKQNTWQHQQTRISNTIHVIITKYYKPHYIALSSNSLRKLPTFGDATTCLPAKWRLRNERRNSILMTRHYPDLGSASDWLNQISHAARPIRSTTQIWVATLHQYWIFRTRSSDVIWLGTFEMINRAQNPITAGKRTMSGWDEHLSFGFRVGHCHV